MRLREVGYGVLCGLLMVSSRAVAGQTGETPAAQNARAFVNAQVTKDYAGVVARFDSNLRQNLTAPQLEQGWNATLNQFGTFKRIASVRTEMLQGNDVAHVKCEFDRVVAYFHIAFNNSQRVTSFYITPLVSSMEHQRVATRIVQQLNAGQFETVGVEFNDDMKKNLPPAMIRQIWSQLVVGRGQPGRVTEPMPIPGQYEILEVDSEFEHGALAVTVTFDAQGKVGGLFARPLQ